MPFGAAAGAAGAAAGAAAAAGFAAADPTRTKKLLGLQTVNKRLFQRHFLGTSHLQPSTMRPSGLACPAWHCTTARRHRFGFCKLQKLPQLHHLALILGPQSVAKWPKLHLLTTKSLIHRHPQDSTLRATIRATTHSILHHLYHRTLLHTTNYIICTPSHFSTFHTTPSAQQYIPPHYILHHP